MRRSTRRRLVRGVLYTVLVGAVVVFALIADWDSIQENFLDTEIAKALWPEVVTIGAKNTLIYTAIAFGGGLLIALVLALMKLSPIGPYRWIGTVYVEFFRGLPALVVIVFFGYGVPIAFNQWRPPGGPMAPGILALMLVAAAYMAETLRAGIQAVPRGQTEAARSLGMSAGWTTTSVVLPQAFRIVIPPLTNEFVLLIKDTSLLFVLGVAASEKELTGFGRDFQSQFSNSTPLIVIAVAYVILTIPLTQLVAWMERRQQRAR